MEVRLKVLVGANAGKEVLVTGPKFLIGRAEDCQLRPRSDLVSRHHCVLVQDQDYLGLRDFGSKNGTLVNGERVVGEVELKAGDRIKVGPLEFEVAIGSVAPVKKKPPVESVQEAAKRTAEAAASASKASDMDVSQWLSTGDSKVATADTRVLNMNETGEIDVKALFGSTPEDQAEESTQSPKPAKLPRSTQAHQPDSRSAAADVLNKFFKRR
jgi:predicted component of type VI protein secretion system